MFNDEELLLQVIKQNPILVSSQSAVATGVGASSATSTSVGAKNDDAEL